MELSKPTLFALRFEDDICEGKREIADANIFAKDTLVGLFVVLEETKELECLVYGPVTKIRASSLLGGPGSWVEIHGEDRRVYDGTQGRARHLFGPRVRHRVRHPAALRLHARHAGHADRIRHEGQSADAERHRSRVHRGHRAPQQHGLLDRIQGHERSADRTDRDRKASHLAAAHAAGGRRPAAADAGARRRQGAARQSDRRTNARTSTRSTRGSISRSRPRRPASR